MESCTGERINKTRHVFNSKEENMNKGSTRCVSEIVKFCPSICASLLCIPFGLMLGWPCPTYPKLLIPSTNETSLTIETSPIPINIDQSAMIAGFLMIGNALGTPFSLKTFFGSKYGITLSIGLMTCGWGIMWQARNIYWLLGSRFLVGFAHGYGLGQLKNYIKEMSEDNTSVLLLKQINLHMYFGIIVIFAYGPFVDFKNMGIIALIITICILFFIIFLPSTPRELVKANKINDAKRLMIFLKPGANVNSEVYKIAQNIDIGTTDYSITHIFKNKLLRKRFNIFWILIFLQQFSGAPATIIYTQILFKKSECLYPIYFSIFYSILFFIANVLGIFIFSKYNKRNVLLLSSSGVSLAIVAKICVIYFEINKTWTYSSVIVMYFFLIAHTLGLGNIPFTYINDFFPSNCRTFVTHFFIMFHSILALIITKLFQVLMDQYDLTAPFYLFLCVSLFSIVFVQIFLPENESLQNINLNS